MVGIKNSLVLNQKQAQSQVLTPQMQQAIRLLQLSTIELQQQITQAVESNPMLELDDSAASSLEESLDVITEKENHDSEDYNPFDDDSSVYNTQIDGMDSQGKISETGEYEHLTEADSTSGNDYENYTSGHRQTKALVVDSYDVYEGETTETLTDHLSWQLELSQLQGADKLIAQNIIDGIDDSGYLVESVDEILSNVQKIYPDTTIEDILVTLKLIQHYDPIGVGSRNIQEYMLIQLNELPDNTPCKDLALKLVSEYINLLTKSDFRTMCQKLSVKEEMLKNVISLITSLNPRPSTYKDSKKNDFIIPDVIVTKDSQGNYSAELNPVSSMSVRINESYRQLANTAKTKEEKEFFKDHLQEANWFIQSIEKRNSTLLKVACCIVKHQKLFMEEGESAMHPMVLNDVATEIEMHESTISRITTAKYIYTPKGTFELKYFFSSSVNTDDGGTASSTAIKSFIKEYIANENPRKPLSDSKISELLNEKGCNVARRTVAKYREALNIAPSSQRKKLV